MAFLISAPAAQESVPPKERVGHMWVDAVNGSDGATAGNPGAAFRNPNGTAACGVTPFLPNDFLDPTQGNVPLLHAPWPFKTVTAAIKYLYDNSPNTPPTPPLPYTSGTGYVLKAAIIHVLPGRYAAGTAMELHNRLLANGETFPIHLPPFVSVRGTSTLNTTFDLTSNVVNNRPGAGPVFEFGVAVTPNSPRWLGLQIPITGEGCWIDRVSFVGARPSDVGVPYQESGAVVLRDLLSAQITLTNCVFFKNRVGLAVVASFSDRVEPPPAVHEATVINCTFADHRICLWNGQYDTASPQRAGIGISPLLLLNNIFDSMPLSCDGAPFKPALWPPSWGISSSDFEGVSAGDLTVGGANPWPGNYNAYNFATGPSVRHYNYPGAILANYPATVPNGAPANPPAANLNIAQFTGWDGNNGLPRGVLFVRDLLCNGPGAAPTQFPPAALPNTTWDRSPMDFRLSPSVALAQQGGAAAPSQLNPLVDAGYGDGAVPLSAAITMGNGRSLTLPPGYITLLGVDQATWPFSSWEQDGEGYANRRFHDHPVYPNASPTPQLADIGADELDEWIAAGYRAMTTSYVAVPADPLPPLPPQMDNGYLIALGPAGVSPLFGGLPDSRGYQYPTPATYNAAYNRVVGGQIYSPWASAWSFVPAGPYYVPTRVDVVPHLLPDLHPWWMFSAIPAPANPIWQWCTLPAGTYNFWLFANPSVGVINPPGTAPLATVTPYEWLDEFNNPAWVPFGPWGAGPVGILTFSNWCVGNDGTGLTQFWDTFPPTGSGVALRFSTEFATFSPFGSTARNVQTMHVFVQ